jgi:glycine/D-amino acid oxidase-like deaminating enzyme
MARGQQPGERRDGNGGRLRTGRTIWQAGRDPVLEASTRLPQQLATDVVIIGAGITGAFLAERFSRAGRRVVVIDRRPPAEGSTAASTAMLLWELDACLLELEDRLGFEAAAKISRQCRHAVRHIGRLVAALDLNCDFAMRQSLYLAGTELDETDLREEHALRKRMGIVGALLDAGAVAVRGFDAEAALLYPGAAEVDPVRLAQGLLAKAGARGAMVLSPALATVYEAGPRGVVIETREGDVVRADLMVLANGYEIPDFVETPRHRLLTSWAIAGVPAPSGASHDSALVWEASEPYLYLRTTANGRLIVGGEDEPYSGEDQGAQLKDQKVEALLRRLAARCPRLHDFNADFEWAGVFGESEDSLPMIGPVPGRPNCYAAFGYGGNGITFSALAAEFLAATVEGRNADAAAYALDRD